MSKFHSITVSAILKITKDCSVVTFGIPHNLKEEFQFYQGQYITIKAIIDGKEERRSYSLCSSPLDNMWQVAVKKITDGVFSTYVNDQLKKGDVLEIMTPNGNFFVPVSQNGKKNYIAFAAGSGITPIISIIKTHLAAEPKCTFKLFYLNRTVKSIIFKEELEQLKNKYFERFEIFHFLTRENRNIELLNGRFTSDKLQVLTNKIINISNTDDCFICGPEDMIHLLSDELTAAGLPKEKIHFELFSSGTSEDDKQRIRTIIDKKVEGTEVTIIDGGKEFHFTMDELYDTILDSAIAAGADLPYACKGGVCSTCRCKIIEGSAEMKVNYALDAAEVAKNYTLSCQAVPTSKKIVIDFGR